FRHLGVVLCARLAVAVLLLLRLPLASLGLALCPGLSHFSRLRSARFLVGRVPAAPTAVLAHLDAVGRVAPRLVGLVVPSLALLTSERHRDSDVSASQLLSSHVGPPARRHTKKRPLRPGREVAERIAP